MNRKPIDEATTFYLWRLAGITNVCREKGYTIAVHGSLGYDLDLIAAPWTEDAVDHETLIQTILDFIGGTCVDKGTEKPHGRRAYTLSFGGGPHIDLSIMPTADRPKDYTPPPTYPVRKDVAERALEHFMDQVRDIRSDIWPPERGSELRVEAFRNTLNHFNLRQVE